MKKLMMTIYGLAVMMPAVQGADSMRLETEPGMALTVDGSAVNTEPYTGKSAQHWIRGANGTWMPARGQGRCLAFQGSMGSALALGECSGPLLFRAAGERGLSVTPVRAVVDISARDAALAFYDQQFRMPNPPPINFTGDVGACNAGTTNPDFRAAVLRRVNFFRGLAGLANVTLDDTFSTQAQSGALLQAANNDLSHTPPTTWNCYNDTGNAASGSSNLALGTNGWDSVTAYVNEDGDLGHRRWVLYSALARIGTGDIPRTDNNPSANALYVIDTNSRLANPALRDGFVAWPPKGFVPYTVVYGTWSFSVPSADFSNAVLTMTDATGAAVAVTNAGPLANGFGDNTYAFQPTLPNVLPNGNAIGPRPAGGGPDLVYNIKIAGVNVNGTPTDFAYTVTIVDVTDPITDITLNFGALNSRTPAGTAIGQLKAQDPNPDPAPALKFTLVAGDGSDDNASFAIDGVSLKTAVDIDFLQKTTWKIRVRADNGHPNGTFEKGLVIAPFAN